MIKEVKEDVIIRSHQIENVNKEIEIIENDLSGNNGVEKYNN